jgi:hypothetical protein
MRTPVERREAGTLVTVRVLMSKVDSSSRFERAWVPDSLSSLPESTENEFHFQDAAMLS